MANAVEICKEIDCLAYLLVGGMIDGEPQVTKVQASRGGNFYVDRNLTFVATRTGDAELALSNPTHGIFLTAYVGQVCAGGCMHLSARSADGDNWQGDWIGRLKAAVEKFGKGK